MIGTVGDTTIGAVAGASGVVATGAAGAWTGCDTGFCTGTGWDSAGACVAR